MHLYTQQELQQLCGVTGIRINNEVRRPPLNEAVVDAKIDITHPVAIAFLESLDKSADVPQRKVPITHPDQLNDDWDINDIPEDITILMQKSLDFIVKKFGSRAAYSNWLKTVKDKELIKEKQLKNAVATGELIRRDYVATHMFGAVHSVLLRILTDSPRTITARVRELFEAGGDSDAMEKLIADLLMDQARGLKDQLQKALDNA